MKTDAFLSFVHATPTHPFCPEPGLDVHTLVPRVEDSQGTPDDGTDQGAEYHPTTVGEGRAPPKGLWEPLLVLNPRCNSHGRNS